MLLKIQMVSPFFKDMQGQCGKGFSALAQTLGRTAIPFIKKYIVPAATQKNINISETIGRWKKESKRRLVETDPFLKKLLTKPVVLLAKTFLTI